MRWRFRNTYMLFSAALWASLLLPVSAHAQEPLQKPWETNQSVRFERDGHQVYLAPNLRATAGSNRFSLEITGLADGSRLRFRGACQQSIYFTLRLGRGNRTTVANLRKFYRAKRPDPTRLGIQGVVDIGREIVTELCPDVELIDIFFEGSKKRDGSNDIGSVQRANGWAIERSVVPYDQKKAWQRHNIPFQKVSGSFSVNMMNDTDARAPLNAFRMSVTPKIRESRYDRRGVAFAGACSPEAVLQVHYWRHRDDAQLSEYKASDDFSALKMNDIVEVARDELIDQCENVEVVLIKLNITGLVSGKDIGTLVRSKNWSMIEPGGLTGFEDQRKFRINMRDFASVLGVDAEVPCAEAITFPLGPRYRNRTEATFAKQPTISQYRRYAQGIAGALGKDCPLVQIVRVTIHTPPIDGECPNEPAAICEILLTNNPPSPTDTGAAGENTSADPWSVEFIGLQYKDPNQRKNKSIDEVLVDLDQGEFGELKADYIHLVRLVHNDFQALYSEHCRPLVQNPVTLEFTPVEVTLQGNIETGRRQTGESYQITMNSRSKQAFLSYKGAIKAWGVGQVLVITAESAPDIGKATQGQLRFYAAIERARTTVESFITTNGCSADRTQRVYENIYRISANKTPLRP